MEQGMARSVTQSSPIPNQAPNPANSIGVEKFLPMEVYRFFNVNPVNNDEFTGKALNTIYKHVSKESKTLGDSLMKLREIERKVGQPALDEHRYTRVYNYIRMREFNDSMKLEAKERRDRASKKYRLEQERIEKEAKSKVNEILEKERKEIKSLEKEENFHFKELNKLSKAYER